MKTLIAIAAIASLSAAGNHLLGRYDEQMTALAEQSLSWPSVTGLVTRSNLEARRSSIGAHKETEYRVEVEYEYIVGDEMYENDVIRFDQHDLSKAEKERLVSAYPKGRSVEVFYNPDKPNQAVLVRGSGP